MSDKFLISIFHRVLNAVRFLLCDSPASEFYMPTFRNTVCSIFVGAVSRKNNGDEYHFSVTYCGLHLGTSFTACFSTRTCPLPVPPPPDWLRPSLNHTFSHINTPTISSLLFFLLTQPMKMEQDVPKRRHTKFRRWGITQKKECNVNKRSKLMQQYADIYLLQSHSTCFGRHSIHHQEY